MVTEVESSELAKPILQSKSAALASSPKFLTREARSGRPPARIAVSCPKSRAISLKSFVAFRRAHCSMCGALAIHISNSSRSRTVISGGFWPPLRFLTNLSSGLEHTRGITSVHFAGLCCNAVLNDRLICVRRARQTDEKPSGKYLSCRIHSRPFSRVISMSMPSSPPAPFTARTESPRRSRTRASTTRSNSGWPNVSQSSMTSDATRPSALKLCKVSQSAASIRPCR